MITSLPLSTQLLHDKVDTVSVVVDVVTCDFKELHPTEGYKKMAAVILPDYHVEDLDGHVLEAKIEELGSKFNTRINSANHILHAKCA